MNSAVIDQFQATQMKTKVAEVRPGETVKVHYKIREGGKERIQIFEGLVIGTKATKSFQGSFTVRKVVDGVGVERTFPFHSPWVTKVERVKSGKVRRAKLNFVREYAMSRRFKLKDKGLAGAMWEVEMPSQPSANGDQQLQDAVEERALATSADSKVEPEAESRELKADSSEDVAETSIDSELVKADEATDNTSDVISEQSVGRDGGELGGETSETEEVPDSETKLSD